MKPNHLPAIGLLFTILLIWSSCKTDTLQANLDQINSLEKKLFEEKNGVIETTEAATMIKLYTDFSDAYPNDIKSEEFLFKAADVSISVFHSNESVNLLNQFILKFPKSEKVPQAMFLKAFTYENFLNDMENARLSYEQFLKKYPEHELAGDAQISLNNLGKSPEEIIQSFKKP